MANVVLPGTYITVRDEGLISVGGVSVGNVGIVGTALDGEVDKVYILSSFTEAKEIFRPKLFDAGVPIIGYLDANGDPVEEPVTDGSIDPYPAGVVESASLLKAIELLFGNGASAVYAVRAADSTAEKYGDGLAKLANELVNIVLLAGQDASNADMALKLQEHINNTETIKRERIGILGSNGSTDVDAIIDNKVVNDKGRIIYIAPGVKLKKRDPATGDVMEETLSGAYTAAALAGLIASLPVQASPTNKTLTISGLAADFNHGQLEKLVQDNVLAVEKREGYRVVKGITTATNVAWHQITTRRIVDKAIYGVRLACNPYIGKLNNVRVRGALKATLDGFLTRMFDEEALTGYSLEVSATRTQEIAGRCIVTMTLQPTFSIDYIMVTMYLG